MTVRELLQRRKDKQREFTVVGDRQGQLPVGLSAGRDLAQQFQELLAARIGGAGGGGCGAKRDRQGVCFTARISSTRLIAIGFDHHRAVVGKRDGIVGGCVDRNLLLRLIDIQAPLPRRADEDILLDA